MGGYRASRVRKNKFEAKLTRVKTGDPQRSKLAGKVQIQQLSITLET
jgi:hypothetical protein